MNLREVVAADERDDLHGPMPAHKVSKAMVSGGHPLSQVDLVAR